MYTVMNFKSKKALKEAVAAGEPVRVFQPNGDLFNVVVPTEGTVFLEGPHYPKPHSWYAQAELKGGLIIKVK